MGNVTLDFLPKAQSTTTITDLQDSAIMDDATGLINFFDFNLAAPIILRFDNEDGQDAIFRYRRNIAKFSWQAIDGAQEMFSMNNQLSEAGVISFFGMSVQDIAGAETRHELKSGNLNPSWVSVGSQNFGIGTKTPAGKLHVTGAGGVFLDAGSVGIGNTAPENALDVTGSATVGNIGFPSVRIRSNSAAGDGNFHLIKTGDTVPSQSIFMNPGDVGSMDFRTGDGATAATPKMTITLGGNVGIGEGVTNPTSKLQVDGTIAASSNITAPDVIATG